ncbi:MAG: S41 family peptidase [Crocinitomicaceae bacterium]|nr:S41 family peptidase [Crocinitomicaceae bacterium]
MRNLKSKKTTFKIHSSLFFLTFLLGTFSVSGQINEQSVRSNSLKFEEILTYVNRMYVDDADAESLTDHAIVSMLEKLDPHTTYISKADVKDANQRIDGNFVGVGVRFQILKDTLIVVEAIPGGPSEKLGIQAGDKIIKIENILVAGVGLKNSDVRSKLLGDLGTKVKVEIQRRNSKKLLSFTITRDKIPLNSVDCAYMVTPKTGYIKLNSFSRPTMDEIQAAMFTLKSKGMENLILDLQNNGGGLLYTARDLADEFLSPGKLVVYSEGKHQPRTELRTEKTGSWEKGRLVVLINENSASASEIVSGAVQDWDRGLVIGRRTFGKGLVQRPIPLSDGSELRLTVARYYTPTGRWIQKPYSDIEAYKNDYMDRYLHGEFYNQDSIKKFPDSLKYQTKIQKRTVYGGGGIMPDIFVPMDTSGVSDYFKDLVRGGHFNPFVLTYVEKNRANLKKIYPNLEQYIANFDTDKKFMDEFFKYVKAEQPDLEFKEAEYLESEKLIKIRLKAMLAQDLWGIPAFYEVYNETDDILKKAIEVIESDQYLKQGLAK